ncbi:protein of unknown function DUF399 [Magnetococcus marinus MC-1]|uniref:PDZ domain-containing protein n=1 Tax=Magnetococcus marinus (strain ATCC BAA-1437 / JCM 17883 / MC-1) TaxID=156889 RepID=A0L839_MAGMM|nr:ChaN family lipoprotein [Magnetococcus marinus]ABK44132.1 protein of unknown function DUF399 [Magnetococcus marinus MC-1]
MAAPLIAGGALLLAFLVGSNMPVSVKTHEIVELHSRNTLTQGALVEQLSQQRVVLVGEQHDDPHQHGVQLQVIQALHQKHGLVAVGMEQFPRHLQPVLDRWSAGALSEEAFLDETEWYFTWGMEPELYLPILRYVRDHHLPLLALNVKRSIIAEIREKGLDKLDPTQRQQLPTPAPPAQAYRHYLQDILAAHHPQMPLKGSAESFIQAQTTWDTVMAQGLYDWAQRHPNGIAIGLAGTGHIEFGYGIPHQLKALGLTQIATVIPWSSGSDGIKPDSGDYAWGTPIMERVEQPPPVRLGILLEEAAKSAHGPVEIAQVMPNSIAEGAGMQAKDRIIALEGQATLSNHHLVRLLRQHHWGDTLTLTLVRDGQQQSLTVQLPTDPPKPKPHHGSP